MKKQKKIITKLMKRKNNIMKKIKKERKSYKQ